jgi:hypothetical protein
MRRSTSTNSGETSFVSLLAVVVSSESWRQVGLGGQALVTLDSGKVL